MELPSYYTPNSELVLEMDGGSQVKVKLLEVFEQFSRGQVSLVRVTEDLRDLPPVLIIKTFDPRFDGIRFAHRMGIAQPWSQQAEAEAEALRRLGTPKNTQYSYEFPEEDDLVGWEQFCYKRMEMDYSTEFEAYQRLQPFQGRHIPTFYGEAKLITTDVSRAIIPRGILIEYIPDAITLHNMNKDAITPTLAKSFLEILKAFHALGVIHNDLNYGNILVGRSENGQARAFIIDFEHACLRKSNSDAEWAVIVHELADTRFMVRLLQEVLATEDVSSFIGEPIDINA